MTDTIDSKNVYDEIKAYIDEVGEKKIFNRTLDKAESLFKNLQSQMESITKAFFKEKPDIKPKFLGIKKKKIPKGLDKQEKIKFRKTICKEYLDLFRLYSITSELENTLSEVSKSVNTMLNQNIYEQWFNWAIDYGDDSHLATHVSKLTHSSSKGTSVSKLTHSSSKGTSIDIRYHELSKGFENRYLITPPHNPIIDCAYPDNKFSSISKLYSIKVGNATYIGDLLRKDGKGYLSGFTKNKDLLEYWVKNFSRLITSEVKKSYYLSKQTYFPLSNGNYHLILPLKSSSLVHALHLEHKKYFEDEQTNARVQRKNKIHSETTLYSYPNKANLHVTGSNHSNASSLNGKRGGVIKLLSCTPPSWKGKGVSYTNKNSIFDKNLRFTLSEEIAELRTYLTLLKNKELSISEPKRNAAVIKKLKEISGSLFDYVILINRKESQENWTTECDLPLEQQLLFEPWRDDEDATKEKLSNSWQKNLSKSYGRWLNKQLKHKSKLKLSPTHEALWAETFANELRKFIAVQEVAL